MSNLTAFRVRRSDPDPVDGSVQIVRLDDHDGPSVVAEVHAHTCDAEAVADRIVALWNANP